MGVENSGSVPLGSVCRLLALRVAADLPPLSAFLAAAYPCAVTPFQPWVSLRSLFLKHFMRSHLWLSLVKAVIFSNLKNLDTP